MVAVAAATAAGDLLTEMRLERQQAAAQHQQQQDQMAADEPLASVLQPKAADTAPAARPSTQQPDVDEWADAAAVVAAPGSQGSEDFQDAAEELHPPAAAAAAAMGQAGSAQGHAAAEPGAAGTTATGIAAVDVSQAAW
jgi:hypothetical protein